jgi:hypothetical protein
MSVQYCHVRTCARTVRGTYLTRNISPVPTLNKGYTISSRYLNVSYNIASIYNIPDTSDTICCTPVHSTA